MDNAIGLGIILSLQDRASAGLKAIRNKLTALRDVSDSMIKRFDEGAKQMMAGLGSMVAGAKVLGIMNNTFGVSVNTAADFEQAMARVGAVSGAVGKDFEALTKQARDLGRDTQYSATQVANSQELLARAGFLTNEIITAMPNLLYMAGAEGMDMARATDIAAGTLRGFGLEANEMARVANVLAQTSRMTNTSIDTLGESFKYVAPDARMLGVSIEEVAAIIGVMGDANIKASQAGTYLRGAFNRLVSPTKKTQEALDSLGITVTNQHGELKTFDALMQELSDKMQGMTGFQKKSIFGQIFDARSSTGMLAVLGGFESGKLKSSLNTLYQIGDVAKEMYDTMSATMQGAMKRLESASEGMSITIGNHLLPVYTKAIDLMAQFKSWLTQLIEEHPIISKAVIGFTAALLGLSGTALILVGALASVDGMIKMWPLLRKIAVYALTSIKAQARMALTSLSGLSVPVIGMIALAGALYYAWRKNLWGIRDMVTAVTEGFRMAWSASTDGIAEIDDALAKKLKAAGILDYAIIVGQVFFRIRKFISGFIEGLKDSYNFVMGIFDWLKGIFSPVIESGQELLKFLGILKPVAKTQTDTWRSWGQLLGRFTPAVIGVIAAFKGMQIIKGIFGDLGKAITGMFHLITAHPIIALITVIAALAVYAYNHWEEITAYVSEKWQKITGLCAKAANWVKRKWQALKNWWNSWTLKDIFAPLIDLAVRAWNFVKRKWNEFRTWWDSWTLKDLFAPVLNFASDVKDKVLKKWEEFKSWWDSWKLFDVFAALGGYVDKAIAYVKDKWQKFTDWLSSLNPFKDWTPPAIDPEKAKAMKAETLQKYGTLNLTPSYMRVGQHTEIGNFLRPNTEQTTQLERIISTVSAVSKTIASTKTSTISAEKIRLQFQNITALNKMSEGFTQRVAEMTQAWQPFKLSLGEGFTQIYTTMQGVADRIRGTVIPAVNELASALSRVASEISAVAQAGNLNVSMKALNPGTISNVPMQYQQTVGGVRKRAEGGIITRPEFALIGEAGREAVIPLENRARGFSLWLEAGRELGMLPVNTITNQQKISDSLIRNSSERSITRSMAENSVLHEIARREIDLFSDRRTSPNIMNMISPESLNSIMMSNTLMKYSAETSNIKPEIMNLLNVKPLISSIMPHADGGIFSQPHIGLVAEAGREAIIPLERQSQGTQLWFQAGRELGLLPDRKTSSSVNTFTSAMMNVIGPESFNSTSNNARSYSSIMNTLKYPAEAISMKPEITNHLNISPLINSITPHTDSEIISQSKILQAYDVIPRIVNALRFQPNVLNTASTYNRVQNTSKSYADNTNILNPLLDMMLVNRFSPEHKEAQFYSVMPKIINSIKLQPNLEGILENRKLYQDMNTVMNRISPENVGNVATMNTQRISQGYDSITRIANAMKLQSENISINRNIESVSRMQKHNIFQYYGIKNAAPLLQARDITNNFAGMNTPIIPHAMGGIFSSPHIGLIAEAGREAVIPLDDRARGIPLLMAVANEIGGADFLTNQPYSMPMLIQQAQNQTAFQTAEKQPDTHGKIAVNVDVKPADVYIDGERIGRISFRWSERQTIRNGIDS